MIPRYQKKEIANIWSSTSKFRAYLDVELALMRASEGELIPEGTSQAFANCQINPKRIDEIEATTKHDVIAFCTSITEQVAPEHSKFFHFGVTSSDIIDTATTLQIKKSLEVILPAFEKMLVALKDRACEHRDTVAMGRSHGMNAEPMSFGQKLLGHYAEFKRRLDDYQQFFQNELTGQLSGAVGNYTIITPAIEQKALSQLGLKVEPVSTQIIPRDRLAKLVSIGALFAGAVERLCVEIRHLHHSDIAELHEGFSKGQKGSSIMPHKKNPISTENLTGMARILRSHLSLALDNIPLWHERDISHSSAERMYLPDHFGILLYTINRLQNTIENLVIHREKIEAKTQSDLSYLSSYYLHHLIRSSGKTREELYPLIQKVAFELLEAKQKSAQQFYDRLMKICLESGIDTSKCPKIEGVPLKDIYLNHCQNVFDRVLNL